MTDPQPQHSPGDRVTVAAVVAAVQDSEGDYLVHTTWARGTERDLAIVRASDVQPVPPTPDPRDAALAAVRALHYDDGSDDCLCCGWESGWPCATREALDGVTPVPAPAASTPTGWAALRREGGIDMIRPDGAADGWVSDEIGKHSLTDSPGHRAVLALRAEEAAAAAPATTDRADEIRARADADAPRYHPDGSINTRHIAIEQTLRHRAGLPDYIARLDGRGAFALATTDDDPVLAGARALVGFEPSEYTRPDMRAGWRMKAARAVLAADDAHRATGSPSPARSDLGGLAAREAGA